MNLEDAKEFLDGCERQELRDHAFGDKEVFWSIDGEKVAGGYFGGRQASVWIDSDPSVAFSDDEARTLQDCGTLGTVERNDSTGPEEYKEGEVLPGLTKEGVLEELTAPSEVPTSTQETL